MWDCPGPGTKLMSLALAGGFLTIGPPGKSLQNCFHHLSPLKTKFSPPSSPGPWHLLFYFLSLNLAPLGISCKWNSTVFVHFDWFISVNIVFSGFIQVVKCVRSSFLFKGENSIPCFVRQSSVYSFICWWTLRLCSPFVVVNNTAMNMAMQINIWVFAFCCFVSIFRMGIAGSYGNYVIF